MKRSRTKPDPVIAKTLSLEEVQAKLAEELLPGEEIFFDEVHRFTERRPAEPSEVALYEPPRPVTGGDPTLDEGRSAVEAAIEKVIINTSPRIALSEPAVTLAIGHSEASAGSRGPEQTRRIRRYRTKEIALAVGLVAAITLFVWWLHVLQATSNAKRKVPSSPMAVLPAPADTLQPHRRGKPAEEPAEPGPNSTRPIASVPRTLEPTAEPAAPTEQPTREAEGPPIEQLPLASSSPQPSSRPKKPAASTAPATPASTVTDVDPEAKTWLNPSLDRK